MNIIPLDGGATNAHQTFSATLGDFNVDFTLDYVQSGQWSMNVTVDDVLVASGVMLEPGCDILENYDTGIGSMVLYGDEPTLDNLGTSNKLVWIPEDDE